MAIPEATTDGKDATSEMQITAGTSAAGTGNTAIEATPGDFVEQCRAGARELHERKMVQEQRMETLIEDSFGQLEQIFNALLQTAQSDNAASQAQFQGTSSLLEANLDRHHQVETKLHSIMAILLGSASQQ